MDVMPWMLSRNCWWWWFDVHRVRWDKGWRRGGCGVGWCDIDPPEACPTGFPSAMDDGRARGIFDDQVVSIKVGGAAQVAQLAQAEQVAGE